MEDWGMQDGGWVNWRMKSLEGMVPWERKRRGRWSTVFCIILVLCVMRSRDIPFDPFYTGCHLLLWSLPWLVLLPWICSDLLLRMSANFRRITRHWIPGDITLQYHRCENLDSHHTCKFTCLTQLLYSNFAFHNAVCAFRGRRDSNDLVERAFEAAVR